MSVAEFSWSAVALFRNRHHDLAVLEDWWADPRAEPLNMYGRRRVGKSWLFRRLAHGKPAIILVAQEDSTPRRGFATFAATLEPVLGVRPQIEDIAGLFTVLYRLAAQQKVLVVIDEFPYLLGPSAAARARSLTAVQAVLEQLRDDSHIKLILAGSTVAEMERLGQTRSPLYGRLRAFDVQPLTFPEASELLDGPDACQNLTRYAMAGGMPRYLDVLGHGDLEAAVVSHVLDRRGGLFNEPMALLHNELRTPATYFTLLELMSKGARQVGDLASGSGLSSQELAPYLETLERMRLVERLKPAGAGPKERKSLWRCSDHFIRFWFRFVRPYQSELEAGADAHAYYRAEVLPHLPSHTAPVFEDETHRWLRREYAGQALTVGSWWGNALNAQRRANLRTTEQIDGVGLNRKRVVVALEAKWTNGRLSGDVLFDLLTFKLPALAQAGFDTTGTEIVLASRSGFTTGTEQLAAQHGNVRLVTADEVLSLPSS
jgi:hypothetical protein